MRPEWWARDYDGTEQRGPFRTRRDAVASVGDAPVLERHAYGAQGGDFEYVFGYTGEETATTWFIFDRNRATAMWLEPEEVERRRSERYGREGEGHA